MVVFSFIFCDKESATAWLNGVFVFVLGDSLDLYGNRMLLLHRERQQGEVRVALSFFSMRVVDKQHNIEL